MAINIVQIKRDSPTLDGEILSSWKYTIFYRVLEEHDDFIMIVDNHMKAYEFGKEYIERSI